MEIENRLSSDYLLKVIERLLFTENFPNRVSDEDKIIFKELGYSKLLLLLPNLSSKNSEGIEFNEFEFIKKSKHHQRGGYCSINTNLLFKRDEIYEAIYFFERLNNYNKERIIDFLEEKVIEYS